MSVFDDLNDRQRAFVQNFISGMCQQEAAIRAGYSAKSAHVTASRLLRHPKVSAALTQMRFRVAARAEMNLDDIRKMHLACYEGALADGLWGAANKAALALGKMIGAYVEKRETTLKTAGGAPIRFELVMPAEVASAPAPAPEALEASEAPAPVSQAASAKSNGRNGRKRNGRANGKAGGSSNGKRNGKRTTAS